MTDTERINQILSDTSRHIEFHSFLSNHLKHAAIALSGLGADADFIERYTNNYAKTTYGFGLEAANPSNLIVNDENWRGMYGKHENFASMVRFLLSRADDIGVDGVIQQYVPDLLAGCVGSLLHGMIHLGWAIHAENDAMIMEGVAYFAFSYVSCYPERVSRKRNDENAVESLLRVALEWEQQPEVTEWVEDIVAKEPVGMQRVLSGTGTQLKIAQVLDAGHELLEEDLAWVGTASESDLWNQLETVVVLLYAARPGNFVILHLITGLFGMEQIANKLEPQDARKAARCFWKTIIAVLLALKAFPSRNELNAAVQNLNGPADSPEEVSGEWDQLVKRAMADSEEHNAKMLYVMQKWWRKRGYNSAFREAARAFTDTPVIS